MVAFYNAGDQAIYNQGYSFIPQERFRLGDPNLSFHLLQQHQLQEV